MHSTTPIRREGSGASRRTRKQRTSDEVVIAVMGATGTGKTTFIRTITGQTGMAVGHGLKSDTQQVKSVTCKHPDGSGRTLTLIDTPGFDDTYRTDAEVLTDIATWLARNYEEGSTLNGLIFFHRISDNRMSGEALRNLEMFKKLCGEETLSNVVLVTSMWDEVDRKVGERREKELITEFWKSMIARGSQVARLSNDPISARRIIDLFRDKGHITTHIAHELVDQKLKFDETDAGSYLREAISKLMAEHRRVVDRLLQEHLEAMMMKDKEMQHLLDEERARYEQLLAQLNEAKALLARPPFYRRLFNRHRSRSH